MRESRVFPDKFKAFHAKGLNAFPPSTLSLHCFHSLHSHRSLTNEPPSPTLSSMVMFLYQERHTSRISSRRRKGASCYRNQRSMSCLTSSWSSSSVTLDCSSAPKMSSPSLYDLLEYRKRYIFLEMLEDIVRRFFVILFVRFSNTFRRSKGWRKTWRRS